MTQKKAFIYSEEYYRYCYGPMHPMRLERLKLTHDLIKAYGLLDLPDLILEQARPAGLDEVKTFHRADYLDILRRCSCDNYVLDEIGAFGLGGGDNPIFEGMWEFSLLTAGASLQCGRLVADGKADIAFNIAGGLHHAMAGKAAGFCYINDIVVTIMDLLKKDLKVAYVDVDAHHGDGVQKAFEDTDRVLTISIHQHGRTLFPGTGFVYETGCGRGQGFSVNLPLYPGTDDELFLEVFLGVVPDLLAGYQPDILVTQLGVDTFRSDPLTGICLTTNGFTEAVKCFKNMNIPWVALGGGGYHLVNVARSWTLAWALMNNLDPPDELPEVFINTIRTMGYREERLRDQAFETTEPNRKEALTVARQVADTVRETLLPVITGGKGRAWK